MTFVAYKAYNSSTWALESAVCGRARALSTFVAVSRWLGVALALCGLARPQSVKQRAHQGAAVARMHADVITCC